MRRLRPPTHVGGTDVEVPTGIKFHLPAPQTVPATHVGGAPPCAARTCLLRSLRRRKAHSLITAACSLRAPASFKTRTSDVRRRYGTLRSTPMQTQRREVHSGL